MLGRAIAHLVEFNTLVELLVEGFAGSAVGWVEGCVVTICTSSPSYFSVAVRTGESRIKNYLLQALTVLPLEISYKRIISLPIRETIFFKTI